MPSSKTGEAEDVLEMYEQALRFLEGKKYAQADRIFSQINEAAGDDIQLRARVQVFRKVCQGKIRSDQRDPGPPSPYDLGVLEHNLGRHDNALELFDRALESDSEKDHIYMAIAAAQVRLGYVEEALDNLGKAIDLNPSNRIQAWTDPELEPLHENSDYLKLIKRK